MPRITRATSTDRPARSSDEGFTLIELLVVVLIIGVLAAIAIPAFLTQREGAYAAAVRADLANASIAAESFGVLNDGFAGLDDSTLRASGYRPSENVQIEVQVVASSYQLTAKNTGAPTKTWIYDGATGRISD